MLITEVPRCSILQLGKPILQLVAEGVQVRMHISQGVPVEDHIIQPHKLKERKQDWNTVSHENMCKVLV